MRLGQLRDFLSILEAGSVRGAARRLTVSQPALTKSLRQLEGELGVKLFQRTPTGVVPTQFGKALSVRARAVRAELRKAEEELGKLTGSEYGSVAVGVGTVVTTLVMPRALQQFREEFPHARVRVMEGMPHTLLPLLRDETLDLVVGARPSGPIDGAFRFRPMFRSPRAVVARKGHPRADAASIAELADADWLGLPPFGHWSEIEAPLNPPILQNARQLIECDSYNSVVALLASTDMMAILSRRLLSEPYAREHLQEIKVRERLPSFSVGLFSRADTPLAPAASAMAKALVARARQLQNTD
jgi:LysR family transcriptional regulator, regulator of abg operon